LKSVFFSIQFSSSYWGSVTATPLFSLNLATPTVIVVGEGVTWHQRVAVQVGGVSRAAIPAVISSKNFWNVFFETKISTVLLNYLTTQWRCILFVPNVSFWLEKIQSLSLIFWTKTVFVLKKQFMKNDIVVRRKLCDKRKRTLKSFLPSQTKQKIKLNQLNSFWSLIPAGLEALEKTKSRLSNKRSNNIFKKPSTNKIGRKIWIKWLINKCYL